VSSPTVVPVSEPYADFRLYVAGRSAALLRTAYLLTGNRQDAEDLLQTALAKTYLAWDRINDKGAVDAYVRRVLVNTQTSWWRRRKIDEYPTDELPEIATEDVTVDHELRDALWRALGRLPRRQRAMVVLRYYEDLTEVETAEALGVSGGTVKSTVYRALQKLRDDAGLLGAPEDAGRLIGT
jgi:RNA polymerase sigma-70 factor (sigma-E family)